MTREEFIDQANWGEILEGKYYLPIYHLAITFTRGIKYPDAIKALWSHPALTGPWSDRASYMDPPDMKSHTLYGLFSLSDSETIGLYSDLIGDIHDFLCLTISTPMLQKIGSIHEPFTPVNNPWLSIIESVFIEIAEIVYQCNPYDFAYLGDWTQYSTYIDGKLMYNYSLIEEGGCMISPELWDRLDLTTDYIDLPSGLRWIPYR